MAASFDPSLAATLYKRNASFVEVPCTICGFFQHEINGATTGTKGHFAKACQSKTRRFYIKGTTVAMFSPTVCSTIAACPRSLPHTSVIVLVCRQNLSALIDSGSSDRFINEWVIRKLNLHIHHSSQDILRLTQ